MGSSHSTADQSGDKTVETAEKPKVKLTKAEKMARAEEHARVRDAAVDKWLLNVRPFDLIVVQGDGVSKLIMSLENKFNGMGTISHVEVAITKDFVRDCTAILPDKFMLSWGSTMSGKLNDQITNIETGESMFGVQLRSLRDLARVYYDNPAANMGVCRLIDNPTELKDDESVEQYETRMEVLRKAMSKVYNEMNGEKYDANFISLLGSIIPALRPLRQMSSQLLEEFSSAHKWLFCSEFVAHIYIAAGIITDLTDGVEDGKILDPQNVVPVDFLGAEQDIHGIQRAICEATPIWVRL